MDVVLRWRGGQRGKGYEHAHFLDQIAQTQRRPHHIRRGAGTLCNPAPLPRPAPRWTLQGQSGQGQAVATTGAGGAWLRPRGAQDIAKGHGQAEVKGKSVEQAQATPHLQLPPALRAWAAASALCVAIKVELREPRQRALV